MAGRGRRRAEVRLAPRVAASLISAAIAARSGRSATASAKMSIVPLMTEDVVEVVDNAAGQLTGDLHPSGLANLHFRGFCRQPLLRHILGVPGARALLQ